MYRPVQSVCKIYDMVTNGVTDPLRFSVNFSGQIVVTERENLNVSPYKCTFGVYRTGPRDRYLHHILCIPPIIGH